MAKTFSYDYTNEDGEKQQIVIKKFDRAMTAGFVRRHRNDDPFEQMFALVEETLDEKQLAIFDSMTAEEMDEFYTAWQEDSGVTQGES